MVLFLSLLVALQLAQPPASLLQQGLRALQAGDLASARSDLEQASRDDPANAYVWTTLAEVYGRSNQRELGLSAAQKAEQLGAGNPQVAHALALFYSHAGDFKHAAQLEDKYAASPRADREALARSAAWYAAAGDDARALQIAHQLSKDPDQTFAIAQAMLRKQQFSDAVEVLSAGLQAHPGDAQLTLALGAARYGQRRFEEAITTFLQVIHLAPDVPQSYLFLGRMLDQAGPHLEAIVNATRAWADKNPENAAAKLVLAKALLQNDPASPEAETLLRRSVELDSHNWESHFELGLVCEQAHQYGPAADEFRKATELDPSQATPHYHLARMYDRLGNRDGAASERAIHQQLTGASAPK